MRATGLVCAGIGDSKTTFHAPALGELVFGWLACSMIFIYLALRQISAKPMLQAQNQCYSFNIFLKKIVRSNIILSEERLSSTSSFWFQLAGDYSEVLIKEHCNCSRSAAIHFVVIKQWQMAMIEAFCKEKAIFCD